MGIIEFFKSEPIVALYGLALILSLLKYRLYFDTILKYLPILIGYTLLNECLGLLIKNKEDFVIVFLNGYSYYNALIYNIFDFCFYLYFFYTFWKILKERKHKGWIKKGAFLFVAISLINPFFQSFILTPQIYSMIVGSATLSASAFLYLKQLTTFKNKKYNNLLFWISLGLLIFYPFYPIIFIIVVYFDNSLYHELHLEFFLKFLACLMYTFFIIGFLKMHRMKPIDNNNSVLSKRNV